MQGLSLWQSKAGLPVASGLDFGKGLSAFEADRRRGRQGIAGRVCLGGCLSLLQVSGDYSRRRRRWVPHMRLEFDWRCEFSSLRFKVVLLSEEKTTGHVGVSVRSAWALERREETAEEVTSENLDSVDVLPTKIDFEEAGYQNLLREDDGNSGEAGGVDFENGREIKEDETPRVDVRALTYSLRNVETVDDVDDILKYKGDLPLQVYSTAIRWFGRDKNFESALLLLEWLKRKKAETSGAIGPNLFIYNSLLGAVKQCGEFDETDKILSDMEAEGVSPNIVTYNTLMAIYLEQGEPSKALSMLEEIQNKGFHPSAVSYSTALLAYRRMDDGFGALKFFVESREKYCKGEIERITSEDWDYEFSKLESFTIRICYQVMRGWLVRNENLSTNVLKLLTEMDKAGVRPGREEHEKLIWACTREEHHTLGKELYRRIRERYSDISLSVCNHLIWLMGKAKKWWAALEIYEDLLDKGPKPNNMSYELIVSHFNVLLSAASKRGIWRWGVRLLNKMEDKGLKPESRQWNAVLVACSKASETTAAIQIFKRMVENGEKPTILSYGALLSALEKRQLFDEALRVWDHMVKMGVEPNLYAYTILASVLTGQKKLNLVDALFKEMTVKGIEPTVVTYNAIISACAKNGMSGVAYEWFHRMKVQNLSPNEITYEMLIEALANDTKPRLAYEIYLRASIEGLSLSAKAYDAVVQSAGEHGATVDLNALGPRPPTPKERKKEVLIGKNIKEFCRLADVPRRSKPFDTKELLSSLKENKE